MFSIPFYIVDVFADAPYKGNQLAVFLNADTLNAERMLQIAKEIGFAESVFITSESLSSAEASARIFTVEYEVPFAGHPTLGCAYVIQHLLWQKEVPQLILHLSAGKIPVTFSYSPGAAPVLSMRQLPPSFEEPIPSDEIASLVGIGTNEIDARYPAQVVSTGLPFLLVPILRLSTMQQLNLKADALYAFLNRHKLYKIQRSDSLTVGLYFFCPEAYHEAHQLNARMLVLENGKVIEDAATGSANGCLLGYLLKHNYFNKSTLDILVEQGYEIGRNATIRLNGGLSENNTYDVNVGGQVQLIAKGEWLA